MRDLYAIVGVTKTATSDEIKAAYRKKALALHPDRGGDTAAFQELQSAYEILGDAVQRAKYDRNNSGKFEYTADSSKWEPFYDDYYADDYEYNPNRYSKYNENWEDLLKAAFAHREKYEQAQKQATSNKSVTINAKITMKQSFTGATLSAKFKLPNGKVKQVLVDIPAGVADQQTIIIKGAGDNSIPWRPAGDLKVVVSVAREPGVNRINDDVFIDKHISIITAMVGSKNFLVDTVDGTPMSVIIQPGTVSGTILKFPGKGFPNVSTGARGTLSVVLNVDIPAVKNIDADTLSQLEAIYAKISKTS